MISQISSFLIKRMQIRSFAKLHWTGDRRAILDTLLCYIKLIILQRCLKRSTKETVRKKYMVLILKLAVLGVYNSLGTQNYSWQDLGDPGTLHAKHVFHPLISLHYLPITSCQYDASQEIVKLPFTQGSAY